MGTASSQPSDPSQFADFDTQTQRGSFRSLAAAAAIYSGAYSLSYLSDWATMIAAQAGS
jgi:hypothetical protein